MSEAEEETEDPTAENEEGEIVPEAEEELFEEDEDVPRYVMKHRRKYPEKDIGYTDKDRAAAVAMGAGDIKESLQVKKKEEKEEDPREKEHYIHSVLARKALEQHDPLRALRSANKAVDLKPEDTKCRIARAHCYLHLGRNKEALNDIEYVLEMEPHNPKAIYLKAESLFLMGKFEFALVLYLMGKKRRPDMDCFRSGIQKCQDAIRSAIGGKTKIRLENHHIERLRERQNEKVKGRLFRTTAGQVQKAIPMMLVPPASSLVAPLDQKTKEKEEKQLLGNMALDKEFCRSLIKKKEILNTANITGDEIVGTVQGIIKFLDNREEFWRQQKPVNPAKRRDLSRTANPTRRSQAIILPQIITRMEERLKNRQSGAASAGPGNIAKLCRQMAAANRVTSNTSMFC